ncbi:hypothetical protein B0T20DRAFT_401498 [Sordaria brevicollis]|uniref:Uncharacterized protein n=1 Tax=Sordaria brevicollis TaxID=83679 RepID=A0AAE0PJT0_SORBR|nr:hypothetical protein B0T20DRAFT_401498 [Sordaria brevicollis]
MTSTCKSFIHPSLCGILMMVMMLGEMAQNHTTTHDFSCPRKITAQQSTLFCSPTHTFHRSIIRSPAGLAIIIPRRRVSEIETNALQRPATPSSASSLALSVALFLTTAVIHGKKPDPPPNGFPNSALFSLFPFRSSDQGGRAVAGSQPLPRISDECHGLRCLKLGIKIRAKSAYQR